MNETFINISKIIERDSKSTTYKFALLRGTIDIIQDNSPYIEFKDNLVKIPLGLLIEKWLVYYYPLLESEIYIPQINGKSLKIASQDLFLKVINYYGNYGGLSAFYNDLRKNGISEGIYEDFFKLVKELKGNIVKNPMQFIGNSVNKSNYSIYKYNNDAAFEKASVLNSNWLSKSCGTFTIPIEYYEAFKILGSFMSGTDNILFKWAEFSVNASGKLLTPERIFTEILKSPVTEREARISKDLYENILKEYGEISCVWTNEKILEYDVDHVIPFSIWKNNDLWNLLPAKKSVNNNKRDKIPSFKVISKRKDLIIYYWELIHEAQKERFSQEIQVSLLGYHSDNNWQNTAFTQLLNTSKYLIETRGYQQWNI